VWNLDKTATLHGGHTNITSVDLAPGESITVDYSVAVTRSGCDHTADLTQEGGTGHVQDSYAGQLGPNHLFIDVPATETGSATFTYSRTITAPLHSCDSFDVTNDVEVLDGNPDLPFATDSLTIHVNVHCHENNGCTLTQGYWKTHSAQGPAPFDANWNNITPSAENTPFFFSGQTWFQVFWTSAAGGNAYYILAHQYEAAVLNKLNGASSTSAVDAAITAAAGWFNNAAHTPAYAGGLSGNNAERKMLLGWATTLGNYNSGLIGPGHCSEDSSSDNS